MEELRGLQELGAQEPGGGRTQHLLAGRVLGRGERRQAFGADNTQGFIQEFLESIRGSDQETALAAGPWDACPGSRLSPPPLGSDQEGEPGV